MTEVNLLFCFMFMLLMLCTPLARAPHVHLKLQIDDAQRSPLARALYVIFFDLKPLIEDDNLQVYMLTRDKCNLLCVGN